MPDVYLFSQVKATAFAIQLVILGDIKQINLKVICFNSKFSFIQHFASFDAMFRFCHK